MKILKILLITAGILITSILIVGILYGLGFLGSLVVNIGSNPDDYITFGIVIFIMLFVLFAIIDKLRK
jgi:hypothetical protein